MRSTTSHTRHGDLIPNSFSNVLALFMPPVYGGSATLACRFGPTHNPEEPLEARHYP